MTANWIDLIILVIMGVSVFFGIRRGLLSAALGILALIVGFYLAKDYAHLLFAPLQGMLGKSPLVRPVSYVLIFFGGVLAVNLFAILLRKVLEAADFGGMDAFGGAVFGLLRGGIFSTLLLLAFGAVGVGKTAAWEDSILVPYIGSSVRLVMRVPPMSDYQNWVTFDDKNRPIFVDAGLSSIAEEQEKAQENVDKLLQGEEPAEATSWGQKEMSSEKIKYIQEFLQQGGEDAQRIDGLESLNEDQLKRLMQQVQQITGHSEQEIEEIFNQALQQ